MFRRLVWNVIPVALVFVALQLAFVGDDGLIQKHQVKQRLYTTRAKFEQIQHSNKVLKERIRRLKTDPVFIQRVVAERLLAAPEGSTIYRFDGPVIEH